MRKLLFALFLMGFFGCENPDDPNPGCTDRLSMTIVVTSESGCDSTGGRLEVMATGSASPLSYSIQGITGEQDSGIFSDLEAGTYTIMVSNETGCMISEEVVVTSGITYSMEIEPIIRVNCAIAGCHNGSTRLPNFSLLTNVQDFSSQIRSRTQSRNMPLGRTLTQEQINQIACWVDDGALDN